jgi:hypothetical protein
VHGKWDGWIRVADGWMRGAFWIALNALIILGIVAIFLPTEGPHCRIDPDAIPLPGSEGACDADLVKICKAAREEGPAREEGLRQLRQAAANRDQAARPRHDAARERGEARYDLILALAAHGVPRACDWMK